MPATANVAERAAHYTGDLPRTDTPGTAANLVGSPTERRQPQCVTKSLYVRSRQAGGV